MVVVDPVPLQAVAVVVVVCVVGFGAVLTAARVGADAAEPVRAVDGDGVDATACDRVARCVFATVGVLDGVEETESPGVGVSCTSTFAAPLLHAVAANSRLSPAVIVPVVRMSVITNRDRGRFSAR
jgi:hypothetical protein